jgi:hypothetical protein
MPKTDIFNEAEKPLKTKGRKLEFLHGGAGNILKKGQLPKNGRDLKSGCKVSCRAEVCTRRIRLFLACKAWRESGRVQLKDIITQ